MEEPSRLPEVAGTLLAAGRTERLAEVLRESHPADVARALQALPEPERLAAFRLLGREQAGEVLHELDERIRLELLEALEAEEASRILDGMPADNAAAALQQLPAQRAQGLLRLMRPDHAEGVQRLLEYGAKTAGRVMSPRFVAVREEASVGEGIERLRAAPPGDEGFYLYVVDDHRHLVGVVSFRRLVLADPATPLRQVLQEEVVAVTPDTDQEEVARLVAKHNLLAIPVVDPHRRLLGTVTVDDAVDILQEEATEDIHRLGGVSEDERVFDPPLAVFPRRLLWRLINLGTALLAASVIGVFEESIRAFAALAVFLPVVASEGGIATTQTATIVIRGLALGDLTPHSLWRVLWKELRIAAGTGAGSALVLAGVAFLWKGNATLSLVCGVALLLNMLLAAVVGALVPLLLKKLRIDPAVASNVILTTFTDFFGFFAFLGLATLLLRFLV